MRILITADLHYRPSRRADYLDFAGQVSAQQPDCFIIAGDIGHPLRLFQRCLQLFRDLPCPRLLIVGNHDVYRGEFDSQVLWQEQLPRVTREEGFIWLAEEPVRYGPLGICGSMGWYDYSARAPYLPYTRREYQSLKQLVSNDADYVDWPWSDVAMARYQSKILATQLDQLQADPAIRQILVVTHIPIFERAIPRYPRSEFWSLFNAYQGNLNLGRLVRSYSKVTHVVSGHLHRRGHWTIDGAHRPIECYIVGSRSDQLASLILEFRHA